MHFFKDDSSAATGKIQMLPVGMIPVFQILDSLAIDLRGRYDPQNKPGLFLAVNEVDQIDDLDSQQGLSPTCWDFKAEIGKRLTDSVTDRTEPVAGQGFYYLFKLGGMCEGGSWQTVPGAEPGRDLLLP